MSENKTIQESKKNAVEVQHEAEKGALQTVSNVNPEALISQAIQQGLPVDSLEKLLTMRRELKAEWSREQYYLALSRFQKECPVINKDSKVDFANKKGGRTKYSYATLDAIVTQVRDLLEAYGFSYTIKTKQDENNVVAICESHHINGHSESTEFSIPIDREAYMNEAQKVASALTYAKRYAFCNAFGIMTGDEDDDSNLTGEQEENTNPECPNCNTNKDVIKSKFPGAMWYCFNCKGKFDDVEIVDEDKDFNAKEARENLLNMARPYAKQLQDEEIKFLQNIKKDMEENKEYSQDFYVMDLQYVQIAIDNLEQNEIIDQKQEKTAEIDNSEKPADELFNHVEDLPKGVE